MSHISTMITMPSMAVYAFEDKNVSKASDVAAVYNGLQWSGGRIELDRKQKIYGVDQIGYDAGISELEF